MGVLRTPSMPLLRVQASREDAPSSPCTRSAPTLCPRCLFSPCIRKGGPPPRGLGTDSQTPQQVSGRARLQAVAGKRERPDALTSLSESAPWAPSPCVLLRGMHSCTCVHGTLHWLPPRAPAGQWQDLRHGPVHHPTRTCRTPSASLGPVRDRLQFSEVPISRLRISDIVPIQPNVRTSTRL